MFSHTRDIQSAILEDIVPRDVSAYFFTTGQFYVKRLDDFLCLSLKFIAKKHVSMQCLILPALPWNSNRRYPKEYHA